jgi:hypothetical protein
MFGAPNQAPGGSLFGGPAPAGGGLFGAPAPSSAFGSTSSAFGSTATTQQQQPQIPAQAALQAHMDASARQEAGRVRSALETLHTAYAGNSFTTIVYNDLTPEQRQLQWVHAMGNNGMILAPPQPQQISEEAWKQAVIQNPDPANYMPVALVGAVALQARVSWQQDRANDLAKTSQTLEKSHTTIYDRAAKTRADIDQRLQKHAALRKKLLDIMRRVEVTRCLNQPVQPDEIKALQRLQALIKHVDSVRDTLNVLQDQARTQTSNSKSLGPNITGMPDQAQLLPVLYEQRQKLEKLTSMAKQDMRDVDLIQQRVVVTAPALRP